MIEEGDLERDAV